MRELGTAARSSFAPGPASARRLCWPVPALAAGPGAGTEGGVVVRGSQGCRGMPHGGMTTRLTDSPPAETGDMEHLPSTWRSPQLLWLGKPVLWSGRRSVFI